MISASPAPFSSMSNSFCNISKSSMSFPLTTSATFFLGAVGRLVITVCNSSAVERKLGLFSISAYLRKLLAGELGAEVLRFIVESKCEWPANILIEVSSLPTLLVAVYGLYEKIFFLSNSLLVRLFPSIPVQPSSSSSPYSNIGAKPGERVWSWSELLVLLFLPLPTLLPVLF